MGTCHGPRSATTKGGGASERSTTADQNGVDTTPEPSSGPPRTSLTGVRIAATLGFVLAAVLVVVGLAVSWWLGLVAVALLPVIPTVFVTAFEVIRR